MRLLFLSSLVVGAYLLGASCERHDWEETKKLHEQHGGHDKDSGHKEGSHEEDGSGEGEEH